MATSMVLYFDDRPDTAAALAPVAGVPLFRRTLLAAQRVGIREFWVIAGQWRVRVESELMADRRLKGAVHCMATPTADSLKALTERVADDVLLVRSNALVDHRCLRALRSHPRGDAIAVAPAAGDQSDPAILLGGRRLLTALLGRFSQGAASLRQALERLAREERIEPMALTQGMCVEIRAGEVARFEPDLYRGLGTRDDGLVDRALNRRISRRLTRWLVRWPITPNQVSLLSLAIGLLAAWVFWSSSPLRVALGLLLYEASVIFDHIDGEIARLKFLESSLGGHLDFAIDTVIHVALTLAMGDVARRVTGIPGLFTVGSAAAAGVAMSALVVHFLSGTVREGEGGPLTRMANRDFFYLILLAYLVLMGAAPGFLIGLLALLAVGSNGFWPAYLIGVGVPWVRARLAKDQVALP